MIANNDTTGLLPGLTGSYPKQVLSRSRQYNKHELFARPWFNAGSISLDYYPANTKHLYSIYAKSAQRLRR